MLTAEERKVIKKMLRDAERWLADARKHLASEEQCLHYLQGAIYLAQATQTAINGKRYGT